jgi:hypothetical protein
MIAIIGLLFFLIVSITTVKRIIISSDTVRFFDIFSIVFGITYGLLPAIFLGLYYCNIYIDKRIDFSNHGINCLFIWMLCAFIFYFFFCLSYKAKFKKTGRENGFCSNVQILERVDSNTINNKIEILSLVCLIFGIVSITLWSWAYGGIIELLMRANAVRGGWDTTANPFAFMKHPSSLLAFASFFYAELLVEKKSIFLNAFLFIISATFSVLYYLCTDGRMATIVYFIVLYFILSKSFSNKQGGIKRIIKFTLVIIIGLVLIFYMDTLTNYFRTGVWGLDNKSETRSYVFISEFNYIIVAGQMSVHQCLQDGGPFLIVRDVLCGLFAWFPSSLKPEIVNAWTNGGGNVWGYNTHMINPNSHGTMPSDIVSTSLYDISFFGLVLVSFFWGCIIKKLDIFFYGRKLSPFEMVIYCFLITIIVRAIDYSELYDTILGVFSLFVVLVVWKVLNKIKVRL